MQNFICREDVLAIVDMFTHEQASNAIRDEIAALPMFPAPNPDWEKNNRNVMGQTEDQFWNAVEKQHR